MALQIAQKALAASKKLLQFQETDRVKCLNHIAMLLRERTLQILQANQKDLGLLESDKNSAFRERLILTEKSIEQMAKACEDIAAQKAVVGVIESEIIREDGLKIQKQKIPIGVILSIFESRPNVVIDASALAIKSGNAVLLKGGKEAFFSNQILMECVQNACEKYLVPDAAQLIESREEISALLKLKEYIHLVVPRGGQNLVDYVMRESQIPVVAHAKGLCHIFVDESADEKSVTEIILNAKVQRPGVCNAVETLLLHKNLKAELVHSIVKSLLEAGVELRVCDKLVALDTRLKLADSQDWETEYLDKILSIKQVQDVFEAISHIQKYTSHHTESILSKDQNNIDLFVSSLDSSCIVTNASTRFNDGGQLGLGAELGISTTKLHAYGPMGAEQMTIARFLVVGSGHVRK